MNSFSHPRKQFVTYGLTASAGLHSPSTIQLARERLKKSFDDTCGVNRADSIITPRGRLQARTSGRTISKALFLNNKYLVSRFLVITA